MVNEILRLPPVPSACEPQSRLFAERSRWSAGTEDLQRLSRYIARSSKDQRSVILPTLARCADTEATYMPKANSALLQEPGYREHFVATEY